MVSSLQEREAATPPTEEECRLATELGRYLATHLGEERLSSIQMVFHEGKQDVTLPVPERALRLLLDLLNEMAEGNAVTLIPYHAELTTQQAANLLQVSRPFLVGLLDANAIPHRKVGTHRRVLVRDLLAYKETARKLAEKAAADLMTEAQELNMGY